MKKVLDHPAKPERLISAAQPPLNQNMKNTHALIDNIKPLLHVAVKMADRHGMDEIRISKSRANEILHLAIAADKDLESNYAEPHHFAHLDSIFAGAASMNNAIAKSIK